MMHPAGKQVEIRKRRVSLRGAVRVQLEGAQPEMLEYTDLSMGGLFVKTLFPFDVGSAVELDLRLMRLPFKAEAEVAWIRPYEQGPDKPCGMGLEFRKLSALQRKALYRQINEALEQGSEPMPGTPPSPAQLASRANGKRRRKAKGSWWSRLTGH